MKQGQLVETQGYLFLDEKGEHLHTLDGKPLIGTSTVLSIVAKPLTWWAAGEAVKTLGWTPAKEWRGGKPYSVKKELRIEAAKNKWGEIAAQMNNENYGETWLGMLDTAYAAHSKSLTKAAKGGTDLHATLEKYVKYCIAKNEGAPANIQKEGIQDFIEWSIENVEKFLWSEAHHFSREHWLGGISDAGCLLRNGKTAIIDFKSAKAAYPNMFWQVAGYDIQLRENGGMDNKGNKIVEPMSVDAHIIIPFGADEFSPVIKYDDSGLSKEAFLAALTLYKANQAIE